MQLNYSMNSLILTLRIEIDNNPYIQFPIKDYPGNYDFKETNAADV